MRFVSRQGCQLVQLFFCAASMSLAHAGCSQPINVPASPTGKFVVINEQALEVSGVYPDLLRSSGKKLACDFNFMIVPRARLNYMFENGTGQLIIPVSQTPERDLFGEFVPLFYSTPVIISARPELKISSIADIRRHPELKVNVVRGYNWGASYRNAVKQLSDVGMVEEVVDAGIIIKKMNTGRTDITILSAEIVYGSLLSLGLLDTLGKKIRYIKTPELEPVLTGAYLSNSLSKVDQAALKSLLQSWLASKMLWSSLQASLPAEALTSMTPLDKRHLPAVD